VARANPEEDGFSVARALTFLAAMRSGKADEEEVLATGREALEVARTLGDPFSIAVAQERVGTSLRRMGRYEEALAVIDEAVRTLQDLDARWELASVLGERGMIRRFRGQPDEASRDLRASLATLRQLKDRSLIPWVVRQLVEAMLDLGDLEGARKLAAESEAELRTDEPGSRSDPLLIEGLMALAEGDRERALDRWLQVLEIERERAVPNDVAGHVWLVGRVFGVDAAGGAQIVEEARKRLEDVHWVGLLESPDRVLARGEG